MTTGRINQVTIVFFSPHLRNRQKDTYAHAHTYATIIASFFLYQPVRAPTQLWHHACAFKPDIGRANRKKKFHHCHTHDTHAHTSPHQRERARKNTRRHDFTKKPDERLRFNVSYPLYEFITDMLDCSHNWALVGKNFLRKHLVDQVPTRWSPKTQCFGMTAKQPSLMCLFVLSFPGQPIDESINQVPRTKKKCVSFLDLIRAVNNFPNERVPGASNEKPRTHTISF